MSFWTWLFGSKKQKPVIATPEIDSATKYDNKKWHSDFDEVILQELKNSNTLEVPDPYYGGSKGFENVYTMLDNACEIIANRLLKYE